MADICEICCREKEAMEPGNELIFLKCGHPYCRICFSKYVISQMNENGNQNIMCPTAMCKIELSDIEVQQLMMLNLLPVYNNLKSQLIVAKDINKRLCPNVNCGKIANKGTECWECECGFKFCFKCNENMKRVTLARLI